VSPCARESIYVRKAAKNTGACLDWWGGSDGVPGVARAGEFETNSLVFGLRRLRAKKEIQNPKEKDIGEPLHG